MPIVTVFRSRLRLDAPGNGYYELAQDMETRARAMPGFLDFKTFSAPDGERVSLITFESLDQQTAWRDDLEHRQAQKRGRDDFYAEYSIQICQELDRREYKGAGAAPNRPHHHSELTDPQLARLLEVLPAGPFSANAALSLALAARVVNSSADISTAIDDLEDAGHLRQVGNNRWEVVPGREEN